MVIVPPHQGIKQSLRATESGLSVTSLSDKLDALPMPIAKVIDGLAAWDAAKTVWREFNAALEDTEARLRRLQQIADTAKQLGTSTTFLTSLAGQAKEYRVEMETLTTMLERAREATRVRLGEGKDAVNEDAFSGRLRRHVDAGNLTADEIAPYRAARDQEGQIRAALDLIEKLRAANRDLAANDLGRAFFGAEFETRTRQGIDLVTAFRNALDGAKAAGSGLAPTAEEIARAEEFRQREEAIAATIRDAIAPAVRDFNELSDVGKRTWIEWHERVAGWVTWLGQGYLKIRDIAAEVKRMAQDWGLIAEDSSTPEDGPLTVRVKPRATSRVDRSIPLPANASARAGKDPIDPDSVANVIRGLEKARDVAEAELKTVEMTNVERARAVALAKAEAAAREDVEKGNRSSAALMDEERNRVIEAADATGRFKDQQKDLEQQLKASADAARYFGDALANAIGDAVLEGKSLSDILGSVQKMLTRGTLQALLSGTGPLASLLGTAPAASAGSDAVGGLAGGIRALLSDGGSPLSSLFSAVSASAGSPTGGVRLFEAGGYTGFGQSKEPAGIVHRGEVVFSQADVSRHGGVQHVEALRLAGPADEKRGTRPYGLIGGGRPVGPGPSGGESTGATGAPPAGLNGQRTNLGPQATMAGGVQGNEQGFTQPDVRWHHGVRMLAALGSPSVPNIEPGRALVRGSASSGRAVDPSKGALPDQLSVGLGLAGVLGRGEAPRLPGHERSGDVPSILATLVGGSSRFMPDPLPTESRLDGGGYTGFGPRKKVAGIVHAGEMVFSQDDVGRHGGVQRVERHRKSGMLGMPGFEKGGAVGAAGDTLRMTAATAARQDLRAVSDAKPDDGGSVVFQTVINNQTPAKVEAREVPDGRGGRRQEVLITEAFVAGARSPEGQQALRPQPVTRR